MILSDRENKLALRRDHIGITPRPLDSAFSSMAIDLTLHSTIAFWTPQQGQPTVPVTVYPARPDFDQAGMKICQLILEEVHSTPDKGYQSALAIQAPEPTAPGPASPAPKRRKPRRV